MSVTPNNWLARGADKVVHSSDGALVSTEVKAAAIDAFRDGWLSLIFWMQWPFIALSMLLANGYREIRHLSKDMMSVVGISANDVKLRQRKCR